MSHAGTDTTLSSVRFLCVSELRLKIISNAVSQRITLARLGISAKLVFLLTSLVLDQRVWKYRGFTNTLRRVNNGKQGSQVR